MLVLNLGHSPLYRHFYKCLYIEFYTFPRHDIAKASFALFIWLDGNAVKNFTCLLTIFILFLAMAKFKQACFAHDLSKKFHTFYTHVIFGCTRHSSNKFGSALVGTKILRSTMPIRDFEF